MTEQEMDKTLKKDNEKIKDIGESLDNLRTGVDKIVYKNDYNIRDRAHTEADLDKPYLFKKKFKERFNTVRY